MSPKSKPSPTVPIVIGILITVSVVAIVSIIAALTLIRPVQIYGSSMEPNYNDGERYLTISLIDTITGPRRGTVIVYTYPEDRAYQYISRVIGLPGDEIQIENGLVYINGTQETGDYLADDTHTDIGNSQILREGKTTSIPEGKYLVLSDNRMNAIDSRQFGYITKTDVVGRVFLKY